MSSQLVKLAIRWLTAQAINAVQTCGSAGTAALLILAIVGAVIVPWAMHGPGRVIERGAAVHPAAAFPPLVPAGFHAAARASP